LIIALRNKSDRFNRFSLFVVNQKKILKRLLLFSRQLSEAIYVLDKEDKANLDWLAYKNLALALLFQAFGSADLNAFFRSCKLWKDVVESENFWNSMNSITYFMMNWDFFVIISRFRTKFMSFYHQRLFLLSSN